MNIREAVEKLKSIPMCQLVEFEIPKGDVIVVADIYDIIDNLKDLEDSIFEGNLLLAQAGHNDEVWDSVKVLKKDLIEGEQFLDTYFIDNHTLEPCCLQEEDE